MKEIHNLNTFTILWVVWVVRRWILISIWILWNHRSFGNTVTYSGRCVHVANRINRHFRPRWRMLNYLPHNNIFNIKKRNSSTSRRANAWMNFLSKVAGWILVSGSENNNNKHSQTWKSQSSLRWICVRKERLQHSVNVEICIRHSTPIQRWNRQEQSVSLDDWPANAERCTTFHAASAEERANDHIHWRSPRWMKMRMTSHVVFLSNNHHSISNQIRSTIQSYIWDRVLTVDVEILGSENSVN